LLFQIGGRIDFGGIQRGDMSTPNTTNYCLCFAFKKHPNDSTVSVLLIAPRPGRGEPSLVLDRPDGNIIVLVGEDGVYETLGLSHELSRAVLRGIHTHGVIVYITSEVILAGRDAMPLTMLKL